MPKDTVTALRYECWVCGTNECEECASLRHEAADEIERLTRERDAAMAIEYAVREWAAGRLTDDGLKKQLAASTTGGDDE